MTSQVGAPSKRQYRKLIDAFRMDRLDVQAAADAAGVSPITAQKTYEGAYAKSYPWCVSIRDWLDGKIEMDLDVYNGTRSPRRRHQSDTALAAVAMEPPEDVREVLERIGAPVEDKAGRERDHRTLLAVTRRITGLRLGSVAESTLGIGKLLGLLHRRAEEVLSRPNLGAEELVMASQAVTNIARIHQAMTEQVTSVVKAEREMNPRDDVADDAPKATPEEAKARLQEMAAAWAPLLAAGGKPTAA